MINKVPKNTVLRILNASFGSNVRSVTLLPDGSAEVDVKEPCGRVAALPFDEHGIRIQHKGLKYHRSCSLEGYGQIDKIFSGQDTKNFLHLFRILAALQFLRKNAPANAVVADIGAGYCELPTFCQTAGLKHDYYCFEVDHKKLVHAASKKIGSFNRVLVQTDLTLADLPLDTDSVDAVVCLEFAEHIPKHKFIGLLAEMDRVSKAGAVAMFSTPNIAAGGVRQADHIYEYTYTEFESLLRAAGWDVTDVYGFGPVINILEIDKSDVGSETTYRNIRNLWPSSLLKPLLATSHPEICKESIFICKHTHKYSTAAVKSVDFSRSDALNKVNTLGTNDPTKRIK